MEAIDLKAESGKSFDLATRVVPAIDVQPLNEGWLIDFGEECVGRARVLSDGPAQFSYGEDRTEALRELDYTEGWYRRQVDAVLPEADSGWLEGPLRRAFRFVRLIGKSDRAPRAAEAVVEHYPTPPGAAFACSDPLLERAWSIAERTTRLCMQQWYEDGIKRDGLLWVGDYRIQYLCNAVLFGDVNLARKSLAGFATCQFSDGRMPATAVRAGFRQPQNIPYMPGCHDDHGDGFLGSWKLWNYDVDYLMAVYEYAWFSGDVDFARALFPSVALCADKLATLDPDAASWGPSGEFLTDLHPDYEGWWGSHGSLAAAQVEGLSAANRIADLVGVPARWEDAEISHRRRFGRFLRSDATASDEVNGTAASRHATARALLAGLTDVSALGCLGEGLPLPQTGYGMHFWLDALLRGGCIDAALSEMRRYWGCMLANEATTCWDAVDPRLDDIARPDTHAMSHCHGWSASVAYHLSHGILGVRWMAPGGTRIRVQPQLGGLRWAHAQIPTRFGPVEVEAEPGRVQVRAPSQVTVEVAA